MGWIAWMLFGDRDYLERQIAELRKSRRKRKR